MKHQRVKKGTKAPFDGVLLTPEALSQIISGYEQQIKILLLDMEKMKKVSVVEKESNEMVCSARLVEWRMKLAACQKLAEKQKEIYTNQLNKCSESTPWYTNPYISFVAGGILFGGLCIAVDHVN